MLCFACSAFASLRVIVFVLSGLSACRVSPFDDLSIRSMSANVKHFYAQTAQKMNKK
nr:MAG TPA: hypothetical protein [Caudoviricetes sp.]